MADLLEIEAYLDAVPRTGARAVPVGPFVLFVGNGPWPYYARPRPGQDAAITAVDVQMLEDRCRADDVPLSIEWVDQCTPSLAAAAEAVGLTVAFRPLLALDLPPGPFGAGTGTGTGTGTGMFDGTGHLVRILGPGEPDVAGARAVAELGFGDPGTGVGVAGPAERDTLAATTEPVLLRYLEERSLAGHSVTAVAVDTSGIVGVGSHQPVGTVTEIVGVATLPAARRRGAAAAVTRALVGHAHSIGIRTVILSADSEDVARIYRRVGFRRVGTSCETGPRAPA